jgi:filamentous hemagglutinin family protein
MNILGRLYKRYFIQSLVFITACCVFLDMLLPVIQATPTAAEVVAGSATVIQSGNTINVQMGSSQAVINWDSLDTSYNETLNFLKDDNFAVLNRVINGGPTRFDGSLFAENGSVFIVNTQGLVFGPTAYIQASQFVGSSLDIENIDFMNGQYAFAGGNGAVVNNGDIAAENVALIGNKVLNAGTITSPGGYVVLAAGDRVLLGQSGGSVFVEVDSAGIPESMDTQMSDVPADILNEGLINADGGTIILAAGYTFSRAVANIGTL